MVEPSTVADDLRVVRMCLSMYVPTFPPVSPLHNRSGVTLTIECVLLQ